MKKRYYVLFIVLVSFLWIYSTKISVHAEKITNIQQMDDLLMKGVVLTAILILDVIVAVIVFLELKKRPKKMNETSNQTVELSEEEITVLKEELQNNLNLDNEEMEYLKSIGYFDSSKKEN